MKLLILLLTLFSVLSFSQEFHSSTIRTSGRIYTYQDSLLSPTIDWTKGNCKITVLNANTTFNMINSVNGAQITVVVYNSSTYTVSWNCIEANIIWSGGSPPIQSTGGKTDIYSFIRAGGKIYGTVAQNF
ncbi:MAG: hypothetical protein P4L35_09895 [Ignavibacteriaceae bacterium]|nr:hypothetical protein [Ignavibacteriaceae bacterium]